MRELALDILEQIYNIPDNRWIKGSGVYLGPNDQFVYETVSKNSITAIVMRTVFGYAHQRGYVESSDNRQYCNMSQIIISILGHYLMWLKEEDLTDWKGVDISTDKIYVLCPYTLSSVINGHNIHLHSFDGIKNLLLNVPVILLADSNWQSSSVYAKWVDAWRMNHKYGPERLSDKCIHLTF